MGCGAKPCIAFKRSAKGEFSNSQHDCLKRGNALQERAFPTKEKTQIDNIDNMQEQVKAIPHRDCAADAQSDFSSDCTETTQEYCRISRSFCAI